MASKVLDSHRKGYAVVVPLTPDRTSGEGQAASIATAKSLGIATNSVAIWEPPREPPSTPLSSGQQPHRPTASVRQAVFEVYGGPGTHERLQALQVMSSKRPAEPHWYLSLLATAPSARGRGLASRLLAHVTAECDRLGLPAYLESSDVANVPLYKRHGFNVISMHNLPDGPTVPLMWRKARPRGHL